MDAHAAAAAGAAHALSRFGYGGRFGEAPPSDPHAWVEAQLGPADPVPGGSGIAEAFAAIQQDRTDPPPPGEVRRAGQIYRAETDALIERALHGPAPFRERLVHFWANHFTISLRRGEIAPLVGDYVREAIRPHVTGRFGDMLLAVMRHPAMLHYLDNAQSVGPASPVGLRQRRGLNENLARECLELHTCTPAAGYAQADVTAFAKVITGWSFERIQPPIGFRFRPGVHEPGTKTVMGRTYPEGEQGGIEALAWLAAHPATHWSLATKLVRHFVADDPPPADVRRIEGVLRDTGGDLGQATLALVRLPNAWRPPLAKLRPPQDYVLAAIRAVDPPVDKRPNLIGLMASFGQPLFTAPFPIGWPDRAEDWVGPEAILRRMDWAYGFAGRVGAAIDPDAAAEAALGPLLSAATASEMRRAGSRRDALTLLLGSPEFQRR